MHRAPDIHERSLGHRCRIGGVLVVIVIEVIDLLAARKPDLIAFTGDMVDLDCAGAEPLFERMVASGAPLGAVMVMGNHDLLDDGDRVRAMAKSAGVRLLEDDAVSFAPGTVSLPHVGKGERGAQAALRVG